MSKNNRKSITRIILGILTIMFFLDYGFQIVASPLVPVVIIVGVVAIILGVNKHKKDNTNYPTDGNGNYINRNYGGGAGNDPHNLDGINKGQTLNSDTFDESQSPSLSQNDYREMLSEKEGMHDLLAAGIIDKNEYDDRMSEINKRY